MSTVCVVCNIESCGMVAIQNHPKKLDLMLNFICDHLTNSSDHLCIDCYDDMKISVAFKQKCLASRLIRLETSDDENPIFANEVHILKNELIQDEDTAESDSGNFTSTTENIDSVSQSNSYREITSEDSKEIIDSIEIEEMYLSNDNDPKHSEITIIDQSVRSLAEFVCNGQAGSTPIVLDISMDERTMLVEDSEPSSTGNMTPNEANEETNSSNQSINNTKSSLLDDIENYIDLDKYDSSSRGNISLPILNQNLLSEVKSTKHTNYMSNEQNNPYEHLDPFQCEYCFEKCLSAIDLSKHVKSHKYENFPYICFHGECSESFTHRWKVRTHLKRSHSVLKCKSCGQKFIQKSCFLIHQKRHNNVQTNSALYMCSMCGKEFSSKRSRDEHKQSHSGSNQMKMFCRLCRISYSKFSSYREHMRKKHGLTCLKADFACSVCNEIFPTSDLLQNHLDTHNTKIEIRSKKPRRSELEILRDCPAL